MKSKMKIATIIGARPQFIKAAVVSRALAAYPNLTEILIHTGQHFDNSMSDIFFEELELPYPAYNLNVNKMGHAAMTGQMMEKIEQILLEEKPDLVLVYGDTNSTLAGALTARKLHIKVAHVEAGLRSFNMQMPEEINRIITDRISDLLFCPTENAVENLTKEGFDHFPSKVINTGDVMQDAAFFYRDKQRKPEYDIPNQFAICTIHREENTNHIQKLKEILSALEIISESCPVVIPLHPRTRMILTEEDYDFESSQIFFIPPVGYLEMAWLLTHSQLVITDSGGLQKEAYFFEKYCITLREDTEWCELIGQGINTLAGSDSKKIVEAFHRFYGKEFAKIKPLYGDGKAGERIARIVVNG